MLPYIDGMYSVYYTAGRIARKISRPAAGRIDTALNKTIKFVCVAMCSLVMSFTHVTYPLYIPHCRLNHTAPGF